MQNLLLLFLRAFFCNRTKHASNANGQEDGNVKKRRMNGTRQIFQMIFNKESNDLLFYVDEK